MEKRDNTKPKPFLKWPGGKQWLVPSIKDFIPKCFSTYYEPFLGAGALFFALEPQKAVISDINKDLINTYLQMRDKVEILIQKLKKLKYSAEIYYKLRESNPSNPVEKAARFIYLNRTCWNGLYRVNKSGKFNVPFGKYKNPLICDESNLRIISKFLNKTKILSVDFEEAISSAKKRDFVYLDPPYATAERTNENGFRNYNTKLFSIEDQLRLARVAKKLSKKECFILISNASHPDILKIFSFFKVIKVKKRSLIAGKASSRKEITELLFSNYELQGG